MKESLSCSPAEALLRWCEPHRVEVIRRVDEALDDAAVDAAQRRLFELVRPVLVGRAPPGAFTPGVHLALLTYAAMGGEERDALWLAAATTLLELSMDLIDRAWDKETAQTWPGEDPRVVEMTGILLMVSVVPLALSRAQAPPEAIAALQQTISSRLLRIAAGEMRDLQTFGRADVTVGEVTAAILGKSGERRALYAVLGGMLAAAPPSVLQAYDEMGRDYGFARQVSSDLVDLMQASHSRDLASGSRSWPIAWLMSQLSPSERATFACTLDRAQTERAAAIEVREIMTRRGAVVRTLVEVELASGRALAALSRAQAGEPAASTLRTVIEMASLGRPTG